MFGGSCEVWVLVCSDLAPAIRRRLLSCRSRALKKARRLCRSYRERGFVVGAEDEATFGLIPRLGRGWAPRGSRRVVLVEPRNQSRQVFAARSRRSFVFGFSRRKRQKDFLAFLEKLHRRWGKVLLFLDNVSAHRGRQVQAYEQAHRKTLKLIYFPAYSPELNPVEPCWKPARQALSNRLLRTIPAMQYHLAKPSTPSSHCPKCSAI